MESGSPGSVDCHPGRNLRIAGQAGQALPVGSIGMIQARGPGLFSGYWNKPDQTREEFTADGFFRTGDLGRVDDNVSSTGRAKDLIISGGYNVYPAEVEAWRSDRPDVPVPDRMSAGRDTAVQQRSELLCWQNVVATAYLGFTICNGG